MHHIHSMSGIIIRNADIGEAHRLISLVTDTDGVIVARAQGIRYEKSKLRYVTQLFCGVRIEVVHGREGWKLVGAFPDEAYDLEWNTLSLSGQKVIARMARIIEWFVDESDEVSGLAGYLLRAAHLLRADVPDSIVLLVGYAQIFGTLGYIQYQEYLSDEYIQRVMVDAQMKSALTAMVTSAAGQAAS